MEEKEIWKDIEGYEGLYEVSNYGRVKSLGNGKSTNKNNCKERILKPRKNRYGYLQVGLYKEGKVKRPCIHRLVAEAFIPNTENLEQVNHIDEDKTNNCVENLEWCTREYNNNYGTRIRRIAEANTGNPKLSKALTNHPKLSKPVIGIDKVSGLIVEFKSTYDAERITGTHHSDISKCCKGKLKSCGGFYWMYANVNDDTE